MNYAHSCDTFSLLLSITILEEKSEEKTDFFNKDRLHLQGFRRPQIKEPKTS